MKRPHRTFAWAFGAFFWTTLATFGSAALLEGCDSGTCTSNIGDPNEPGPALECPSGELCFRGRCIRACTAGLERGQACSADSDCEAARPRCIDGFCSVCEFGERCVPQLDICQPLTPVELPEIPNVPPPGGRPPGPLDAGDLMGGAYLDGGLSRIRDAGPAAPPPEAEVTHVGFIDLAIEDDYRNGSGGVRATSAKVTGYDVQGNGAGVRWRADFDPPRVQCRDDDEDRDGCGLNRPEFNLGACVIRPLRTVTASSATGRPPQARDLGDITVDTHVDFTRGILNPINATFAGGQYVLNPPSPMLPVDVYQFSEIPFTQSYLQVSSTGAPNLTVGSWPNPPQGVFLGHHVPFALEAVQDSINLLSSQTTVPSPPDRDLFFQWIRIETGNDSFERVIVRMVGTDHELFCDALEGAGGENTIELQALLLQEWRNREPAGTYDLYFERASAQRLDITAVQGALMDVTVRVRHSLVGSLTFQ